MEPTDERNHESHNEESPLLGDAGSSNTQPVGQHDVGILRRRPGMTSRSVLLCAALIITSAVVELSFLFQMLATNQIIEEILCSHIGLANPAVGEDCGNSEAVQAEIALLRGWQTTFDFVPGELTST